MNDTRYPSPPDRVRAGIHPHGVRPAGLLRRHRPPAPALAALLDADVRLVDSGTSALQLALRRIGVGPRDEVVVGTFNCPSVADAVLAVGATPVLCDAGDPSGAPSTATVAPVVTPTTRAVVLTHQFGAVADDTPQLLAFARERGLAVVDDAAQAIGATVDGRAAGTLGDAGVLSFGRTKPLSCLGGGALVLPRPDRPTRPCSTRADPAHDNLPTGIPAHDNLPAGVPVSMAVAGMAGVVAEQALRRLAAPVRRMLAPPVSALLRRPIAGPPAYRDVARALAAGPPAGPPRAMCPTHARLLAARLAGFDAAVRGWRLRASRLAALLAGSGVPHLPVGGAGRTGSSFVLLIDPRSRFGFAAALAGRGVASSWYHYPLHRQARYQRFARREYPAAERLWPRLLSVPCRDLAPPALRRVADAIRAAHRESTR